MILGAGIFWREYWFGGRFGGQVRIIINQAGNSTYLNKGDNIYLSIIKEIFMERTTPEDILQELARTLSTQPNSLPSTPLLARLYSQLPHLANSHRLLHDQLAHKNTQFKQVSRKLRKANSKLAKKQEEADELKKELERVNAVFSQKIQKISKWQGRQDRPTAADLPEARKTKKETLRHTDAQCQILDQSHFHQLSLNNDTLRDKLEQTQKLLQEEKRLNRDLTLRLEVLNVCDQPGGPDQFKDNSTLDADSMKGDPFWEEEEEEWEGEKMGIGDEAREGWVSRTWTAAWKVYQNWTCRQ